MHLTDAAVTIDAGSHCTLTQSHHVSCLLLTCQLDHVTPGIPKPSSMVTRSEICSAQSEAGTLLQHLQVYVMVGSV